MAKNNALKVIVEQFLNLRRENCRTLARLKALEAVIAQSVPLDQREAWYALVDRQYAQCLQDLLEEAEKHSPHFAALLDDRGSEELQDLE